MKRLVQVHRFDWSSAYIEKNCTGTFQCAFPSARLCSPCKISLLTLKSLLLSISKIISKHGNTFQERTFSFKIQWTLGSQT